MSIFHHQEDPGVLAAPMSTTWDPCWGSDMQRSHLSWWTAMGLSTFLTRCPQSLWPPYQWPSVEASLYVSMYEFSLPSHMGPSWRSTMQWKTTLSWWTALGLSMLQSCGSHSHSAAQLLAGFELLSTCMCSAQGCCCRRWRGCLPCELVSMLSSLPRSLHCGGHCLSTCVRVKTCQVPHVMLRT